MAFRLHLPTIELFSISYTPLLSISCPIVEPSEAIVCARKSGLPRGKRHPPQSKSITATLVSAPNTHRSDRPDFSDELRTSCIPTHTHSPTRRRTFTIGSSRRNALDISPSSSMGIRNRSPSLSSSISKRNAAFRSSSRRSQPTAVPKPTSVRALHFLTDERLRLSA